MKSKACKKFTSLYILPALSLSGLTELSFAQAKVQNPLTQHLVNPVGIETEQPRFSWQLFSDKRNVLQTAYEIRVGSDVSSLGLSKNLNWSSG